MRVMKTAGKVLWLPVVFVLGMIVAHYWPVFPYIVLAILIFLTLSFLGFFLWSLIDGGEV